METTTTRKSFTRIGKKDIVRALIKEAKRVGYLVEKDDMSFHVKDDSNGHSVVRGIQVNRGIYGITYFTEYWQEPEMV
jgi:hypothetical protein